MKLQNDENTELLIDLLIGALEEEGYEVLRYKDSKTHHTSGYDRLAVKRADGVYFTIDVEKCIDKRHPFTQAIRYAGDTFEELKAEKEGKLAKITKIKPIVQTVQEDTKVGNVTFKKDAKIFKCGNCTRIISPSFKFCPECGKEIEIDL